MPVLERVREIALLLGVADPQGLVNRGATPVEAYGVEAYSLALLEEQHPAVTEDMVRNVFTFWYDPIPGWALASERDLHGLVTTLAASRPF